MKSTPVLLVAAAFGMSSGALPVKARAQSYSVAQTQIISNQMLDAFAARVNADISSLNADDVDYGGHRILAIKRMRAAHDEIAAAEAYARDHGYGAGAADPGAAVGQQTGGVRRTQGASDSNVTAVQNDLQALLNQLRTESRDYGGHREGAANELSAAIRELGKALRYRQLHGGA